MPEYVRITDVSPRDGLQNEPGIIPTPEKVRLVELLAQTGVDEIEVTSFVSPKWVPQLEDAKEVLRALKPLPEGGVGVGSARLPNQSGQGDGFFAPGQSPARQRLTLDRAHALRHAMTGPEHALWDALNHRALMGFKFRRQHPFGPYILDFYCHELRLAVEVDGRTHRGVDARDDDAERDAWVRSQGVRTIRVSNDSVVADPISVARRVRDIALSLESGDAAQPTPTPPSGRGFKAPMLSVLVPNSLGFQGVADANRHAYRRLVSKVSLFTAASETFSKKNTNATIAETIERFRPVITTAHAEGLLIRAYISCVIACPFEGAIAPGKVVEVARQLFDLGADEIDLGDTIGAGTPETTAALLREYEKSIPIRGTWTPLTLHLHDTFGRAKDCVLAALDAGVRSFDGSVAGLGGCPYASKKLPDGTIQRAPGNISTELLVRTVHAAGYETGVDLDKIAEAAAYAQDIVGKSRASSHGGVA